MLVGAEIGHDFPAVGVGMRLLSQIFIRMIKTIIAPLLFATLVVGIAGHPNLRHVGRMGVKALVYFEVVTTLALLIGLAAINLTRAGVGVQAPPELHPAGVTGVKQTLSDVLLDAFPENVAKAVAEGHVLQIVVFSILFAIALVTAARAEAPADADASASRSRRRCSSSRTSSCTSRRSASARRSPTPSATWASASS